MFLPGCAVMFWSYVTISKMKALAKIKPKQFERHFFTWESQLRPRSSDPLMVADICAETTTVREHSQVLGF